MTVDAKSCDAKLINPLDSLQKKWKLVVYTTLCVLIITIVSLLLINFFFSASSWTVRLRFIFQNVENGLYPDGSTFTAYDMLTPAILTKVYSSNNLQNMITYDDFRARIEVEPCSELLEDINREYMERKKQRNLSFEELELTRKEFQSKIREAKLENMIEYNLIFRSNTSSLNEDTCRKILLDIIKAWTLDADVRRNAFRYRIPILSEKVIGSELLEDEDYIICIDQLSIVIDRIQSNIEDMRALPGAKLARTDSNKMSLWELDFRLSDVKRMKLMPLLGLIQMMGLTKDSELSLAYLDYRITNLEREMMQGSSVAKTYRDSLNEYLIRNNFSGSEIEAEQGQASGSTTIIPQFSDDFIDRVIDLAALAQDNNYRRDIVQRLIETGLKKAQQEKEKSLYEDIKRIFTSEKERIIVSEERIDHILQRIHGVENELNFIIGQLNELHEKLSQNNITPQGHIYKIIKPISLENEAPFSSWRIIGMISFFVVSLWLVFSFLTLWLRERLRHAPS